MDDLMRRSIIRGVTTFLAVAVLGSVLVAAMSDDAAGDAAQPSPTVSTSASIAPPEPQTWLAWVPGGLPSGFGDLVGGVEHITATTTAAADIAWLTASFDANGDPVDQPGPPMMIPLDTTAVDPTFAAFVPEPERQLIQNLRAKEAILSEAEASLRGLGAGSALVFQGGDQLRVAGTLPDDLMGSYEMLVTRQTGRRIAVVHDRYVLFHAGGGAKTTPEAFTSAFEDLLPSDAPYPVVEVRAPGDTRFLRANDRAMPPLLLKRTFGEFLAQPVDATELEIDPTWVQDHIRSITLPALGTVTCNEAIVPALKQAARLLAAADQTALVTDVGTCFAPTLAISGPNGPIDEASWGVSIQLNPSVNLPGESADQSKLLVQAMDRAGFGWAGADAYPQGALFRYQKANQAKD
jgi:hypothetical protein